MLKHLKDELHNVISGKSQVRFGTTIQAITGYLKDCAQSSGNTSDKEQVKNQEKEDLENYISNNSLWIADIDFSQYVSEGAEQKVYLKDSDML